MALKTFLRRLLIGNASEISRPNRVYTKHAENLQAIWRGHGYADFGIERVLRLGLVLLGFITPGSVVRALLGRLHNRVARRVGIEIYGLFKSFWPLAALYYRMTNSKWALVIVITLTADTLHFLGTRIFLDDKLRQPLSARRSLLLTTINYIEVNLAFAFSYSYIYNTATKIDPAFSSTLHLGSLQFIYFSFVTAATIGYGDITPKNNTAILTALLQIVISLFFVLVVITTIVSKLSAEQVISNSDSSHDKHSCRK